MIQLSQKTIHEIMESTRPRLKKKADEIAKRAERLTDKAGVTGEVQRESGTRPGGRPYERIIHTNKTQEYGVFGHKRFRILGKAANL